VVGVRLNLRGIFCFIFNVLLRFMPITSNCLSCFFRFFFLRISIWSGFGAVAGTGSGNTAFGGSGFFFFGFFSGVFLYI